MSSSRRLDCFGIATAVLCGCHALGLTHVHLMLSEDHAWLGWRAPDTGTIETAEVSRAELRSETKASSAAAAAASSGGVDAALSRGDRIRADPGSWLYLNGHGVLADGAGEAVGCMVSNINSAIDKKSDGTAVMTLKRVLLWILYRRRVLSRLPFALDELADLEESFGSVLPPSPFDVEFDSTAGISSGATGGGGSGSDEKAAFNPRHRMCLKLFRESITASRSLYAGHFVYPETMYSSALTRFAYSDYRAGVIDPYRYSTSSAVESLPLWLLAVHAYGDAACAASKYAFSGAGDSELLKEISAANEYFLNTVKWLVAGASNAPARSAGGSTTKSKADGKSAKRKSTEIEASPTANGNGTTSGGGGSPYPESVLAAQTQSFFALFMRYFDHVLAWDERSSTPVATNFIEPALKILQFLPPAVRASLTWPEADAKDHSATASAVAPVTTQPAANVWPFTIRSVRLRELRDALAAAKINREVVRLRLQHTKPASKSIAIESSSDAASSGKSGGKSSRPLTRLKS